MKRTPISKHADHQQLLLSPPAGLDDCRRYWNSSKIPHSLVLCFKSYRVTRAQEECWQKKRNIMSTMPANSILSVLKVWISRNSNTEQDKNTKLPYWKPNQASHNKPTYRLQLNHNWICRFKSISIRFPHDAGWHTLMLINKVSRVNKGCVSTVRKSLSQWSNLFSTQVTQCPNHMKSDLSGNSTAAKIQGSFY